MHRDMAHYIILDTIERSIGRFAQPRCILNDGIEHWLNVRRRAGNHAQDLARGVLPQLTLGEFTLERFDPLYQLGEFMSGGGLFLSGPGLPFSA
jgi:hypothetical protein